MTTRAAAIVTEDPPTKSELVDRERKLMTTWTVLDRTANRLAFKRETLVSLTSDSQRYRDEVGRWEALADDYRAMQESRDRDHTWSAPTHRSDWIKQIKGLEGDLRRERDRVRKYDAIIDLYIDAIEELERELADLRQQEQALQATSKVTRDYDGSDAGARTGREVRGAA